MKLEINIKIIIFFFRPFFTYWVTFVQIVVFIVSVAVYGIAPIGHSETIYSEAVSTCSQTI